MSTDELRVTVDNGQTVPQINIMKGNYTVFRIYSCADGVVICAKGDKNYLVRQGARKAENQTKFDILKASDAIELGLLRDLIYEVNLGEKLKESLENERKWNLAAHHLAKHLDTETMLTSENETVREMGKNRQCDGGI